MAAVLIGINVTEDITLLYGIGAMKAGTTWLYDFLSKHPDCHFSGIKEIHYFDVLFRESESAHLHRRIKSLNKLASVIRPKLDSDFNKSVNHLLQTTELLSLYASPAHDHSRYIQFLLKGHNGQKIVGDITPSYACLNQKHFLEMDSVSSNSLFIFIMRDPVQRLWSAVRMHANEVSSDKDAFDKRCIQIASDWLRAIELNKTQKELERSDYKKTIQSLEMAIPTNKILYMFYEDMFKAESINRLCDFLNIKRYPADFYGVSNQGNKSKMPPDIMKKMRAILLEQYNFISDKFGDEVPLSWRE